MIDLTELALLIAQIASETEDPSTGRQLVDLVYDLLTEAGLPMTRKLSVTSSQ
jgi:hypothetical protein